MRSNRFVTDERVFPVRYGMIRYSTVLYDTGNICSHATEWRKHSQTRNRKTWPRLRTRNSLYASVSEPHVQKPTCLFVIAALEWNGMNGIRSTYPPLYSGVVVLDINTILLLCVHMYMYSVRRARQVCMSSVYSTLYGGLCFKSGLHL